MRAKSGGTLRNVLCPHQLTGGIVREVLKAEHTKLLILALIGLLFSLGFASIINGNPTTRRRSDLYIRWYAVDRLFAEGRSLYDSRNGEEVARYVWGEGFPWTLSFYYPAHLLVLMGPLALLPYPVAHLIWTFVIQIFLLAGLWLIMRAEDWPDTIAKSAVLMAAAVLYLPNLQHTFWGQFNTIGVLSLALCIQALHKGRYGLAGVWAIGLTLKPHTTVLALAFLLIWALFKRERWRFYLGFGLTGLGMWAVGELFEPGWVFELLGTLGAYGTTRSVVDLIWNPYQLVAIALCLLTLAASVRNRQASAQSPAFAGCLVMSLVVGAIAIPTHGMVHLVVMPAAIVWLLSGLKRANRMLYSWALYGILLLYVLGLASTVAALLSHDPHARQAVWAISVYDGILMPVLTGLFSVPLCFMTKDERVDD